MFSLFNYLFKRCDVKHVVEPIAEQHAVVEPIAEQNTVVEPIAEQHAVVEPIAEQHAVVEPIAEQNTVDEPIAEQNTVVEPIAEQNTVDEPIAEQNTVVEPIAEQNTVVEPIAEQNTVVEPIAEQNTVDEPIAEQHAVVEPIAEQNTVDEPIAEEPIVTVEKLVVKLDESSSLFNLFSKSYRGMPREQLDILLQNSSAESMIYTLKIIAHMRDVKGNKGERDLSRNAYYWLAKNHENQLIANMRVYLEKYGRWDDLVHLPIESNAYRKHLEMICQQLNDDLEHMMNGEIVSLVAKWIPSEKSKIDFNTGLNNAIAKEMGIDAKELRKKYLTPLRKYIIDNRHSHDFVETNHTEHSFESMINVLCDSRYDDICCSELNV